MKVLLTGSTGLIGSSVSMDLSSAGHTVVGLRRNSEDDSGWNPETGAVDLRALDGADAVIHLAGASIAGGRWTAVRKRLILESRVGPTAALARFLAQSQNPPATLIVASAIGYYGDRGSEWLDESASAGQGFLADVVQKWEAASAPAREHGLRVVNLRFGIILTPAGGALKRMLLPFRLGLGGPIGGGRQYWSWVGLDDVVGVIRYALDTPSLSGPINVVSPNPVSNSEFTRTLARVVARPAIFPLPGFVARLALGEMATELLLYSARVRPGKLIDTAFPFRNTELESCLRAMLTR